MTPRRGSPGAVGFKPDEGVEREIGGRELGLMTAVSRSRFAHFTKARLVQRPV